MSLFTRIIAVLIVSATVWSWTRAETKDRTGEPAVQPVATSGTASANAGSPASIQTAPNTGAAAIDPGAIRALDKMANYLRTLSAFQIASETTLDEVFDDGQRVQFGGHVDMLVQRPNRFRAEVTSDRHQRLFFYDGKSFTLWARRANFYATVPAPATLAELGDRLQKDYAIELPLADLFYWGSEGRDAKAITAAADIGSSQIEGVSCEHYAFRQAAVDWQIWLQQGNYPLPRKIVITTTSEPARPQYTSVMTWNLAPAYNDAAFTFDPPSDAHNIKFEQTPGGTPNR